MSFTAESVAEEKTTSLVLGRDAAAPARPLLSPRFVSGAEWDEEVAGFDGVVQEQLHVFAQTRWPGVRHEPLLFMLGEEVIGGALIMIQPLPLGIGAIAVCKWGPIFKQEGRPDRATLYEAMIEGMIAEFADKRGLMLSVMPRASVQPQNAEYEHLMARGFRRGSQLRYPCRYIVNLRLSDEEQRKSFHQKWRYHLNKSEKAGLSFEHAEPGRTPEFDALYQAMTDRKQFPDHSAYETVPALMAISTPSLRPELFFVRHEGEVVAGAIIFKAGETAVYLYGATNDKALPLRAGYFLHWHIIRWLRDNTQAKWYDLGGTDGFQGLHQFKKGMVGEAGVMEPVPSVANYASHPLAFVLGSAAFLVRDLAKQAVSLVERLRAASPDQRKPDANPSGEGER